MSNDPGKILFDALKPFGGKQSEDALGFIEQLEASMSRWIMNDEKPVVIGEVEMRIINMKLTGTALTWSHNWWAGEKQAIVDKEWDIDALLVVPNTPAPKPSSYVKGGSRKKGKDEEEEAAADSNLEPKERVLKKGPPLKKFVIAFKKEYCSLALASVRLGAFFSRNQKPGESVLEYNDALLQLCSASAGRIDPGMLFVKFTTGVREDIKADLDVMQPNDLNDALKLAIAIERKLTLADAKVNATRRTSSQTVCDRCGGKNHYVKDCKVDKNSLKCTKCGKIGHIEKVCRSKLKTKPIVCFNCREEGHKKVNCPLLQKERKSEIINALNDGSVDVPDVLKNPWLCSNCHKYHTVACPCLKSIDSRLISTEVVINDVNINSLVDCGSTCAIMDYMVACCLNAVIEPCSNTLKAFNGAVSAIVGTTSFTVVAPSTGKSCEVKFYVSKETDYPVLLGMDCLRALGFITDADLIVNNADVIQPESTPLESSGTPEIPEQPDEFMKIRKELLIVFNSTTDHLTDAQCKMLVEALRPFADRLIDSIEDLKGKPPAKADPIKIVLTSSKPVWRSQWMLSQAEIEWVEPVMEKYIDIRWIRSSRSPYNSPIQFVPKKDGEMRWCSNLTGINDITEKDGHPVGNVQVMLDCIAGALWYSSMDCFSGYRQMELDDEAAMLTAFTIPSGKYMGHWEWTRLIMGAKNSGAKYQRAMNKTLMEGLGKFVGNVIDDSVVYTSADFEDHLEKLKLVLSWFQRDNWYLKRKKCSFGAVSCKAVGHVADLMGISPDPAKILKIKNAPRPSDKNQLRSWLGLANYYRDFIPNFSTIADPLNSLLKKNVVFMWTSLQEHAVQTLLKLLENTVVLKKPDPNVPYVIVCDASAVGIGGVLMQDKRPVRFASRSLQPAEKNYSVFDRETLALVYCLKKFRIYIWCKPVLVLTDHKALVSILNNSSEDLSGRRARHVEFICRFDIKIQHLPGTSNLAADALSRPPFVEEKVNLVSVNLEGLKSEELIIEQRKCLELAQYFDILEGEGSTPNNEVSMLIVEVSNMVIEDGILYHLAINHPSAPKSETIMQIVIPMSLRDELLRLSHDKCAHGGLTQTYHRLKSSYWWRKMFADVKKYVASCSCQNIRPVPKKVGPLQIVDIEEPWTRLAIDYVGPLPLTKEGNRYALVVMDPFTGWCDGLPTDSMTTETTYRKLYRDIFCKFGFPRELLSDRQASLIGKVAQQICDELGIKKITITAEHQQADPAERMIQTIFKAVKKLLFAEGGEWDQVIHMTMFAIRTMIMTRKDSTPFELLFFRSPRLPSHFLIAQPQESRLQWSVRAEMENEIFQKVRDLNLKSKLSDKLRFDKAATMNSYQVGELVGLHTSKKSGKLVPKVSGPFRIVSKVTDVNYRIMPVSGKLKAHPVVHVSRLGRWFPVRTISKKEEENPGYGGIDTNITFVNYDPNETFLVEEILDYGELDSGIMVFLTKYAGDELPSWQPAKNFKDSDGSVNSTFSRYCQENSIEFS